MSAHDDGGKIAEAFRTFCLAFSSADTARAFADHELAEAMANALQSGTLSDKHYFVDASASELETLRAEMVRDLREVSRRLYWRAIYEDESANESAPRADSESFDHYYAAKREGGEA